MSKMYYDIQTRVVKLADLIKQLKGFLNNAKCK